MSSPTKKGVRPANGAGTASFVTTGTTKFLITQTDKGEGTATEVKPNANSKGRRLTWIKRR